MEFRAELYDEHGDCLTLSYVRVYVIMYGDTLGKCEAKDQGVVTDSRRMVITSPGLEITSPGLGKTSPGLEKTNQGVVRAIRRVDTHTLV